MSLAERMTTAASPPSGPQTSVLPTLFGEGYGTYSTRPSAFVFSFTLNILVAALLVWSGHWVVQHRQQIQQRVVGLVTDISPYVLAPSAKNQVVAEAAVSATNWRRLEAHCPGNPASRSRHQR